MPGSKSDAPETTLQEYLADFSVLEPHFAIPRNTPLYAEKTRLLKEFAEKNKLAGEDTKALVVGRFQPPHAGHLYVIVAALSVADKVVIGIGSANVIDENNPFPPAYRERVLRYALKKQGVDIKRVKFILLDDVGNNERWGNETYEKASQWGPINAVVGNSEWVNGIFEEEKYKNLGLRVLRPGELGRKNFNSTRLRQLLRRISVLRPIGK